MTSENLTPETFNVLDVLSGVAYPSTTITLHLNEEAARLVNQLREKVEVEYSDTEVPADLSSALAEAREALEATKLTFHLRGISTEVERNCRAKAKAKFPDKKQNVNGMQIAVPTEEQETFFQQLVIAAHCQQIVNGEGKIHTAPDVEVIEQFYYRAPFSQVQKLIEAVNSLKVDAGEFEAAVSDDFLAKP